jgi:hypothetical protein
VNAEHLLVNALPASQFIVHGFLSFTEGLYSVLSHTNFTDISDSGAESNHISGPRHLIPFHQYIHPPVDEA